jgi:NADH dehydrogenase (ubiquinone) 1 beta subcomplex subunit 7
VTVSYVSREEMHDAKVPLDYRDYCAHLLIPLNRCRQQEMYLPWKCETLRNAYEKCQHNDYTKRRAIKAEQSQ